MLRKFRLPDIAEILKLGFSKRLLWRVLFIALLSTLLNAGQFYFFYAQTLEVLAQRLSFQLLPEEFNAVAQSLPSIYEAMSDWLLLLLLLQLTVATGAGFWLSYRLYGPVSRIRNVLVDISMGKLSSVIQIRKGDELVDIAEDINDSTARIQVMVMSMKDNLAMLEVSDLPAESALHLDIIRDNLEFFETLDLEYTEEEENEPVL